MSDNNEKELTKEEHVLNYAKALDEIDKCIEPYRDHRKALKESYKENGWLSKEEMSQILRAYRMLKKDEDVNDIVDMFNVLKGKIR